MQEDSTKQAASMFGVAQVHVDIVKGARAADPALASEWTIEKEALSSQCCCLPAIRGWRNFSGSSSRFAISGYLGASEVDASSRYVL